jgi:hypothetical protein
LRQELQRLIERDDIESRIRRSEETVVEGHSLSAPPPLPRVARPCVVDEYPAHGPSGIDEKLITALTGERRILENPNARFVDEGRRAQSMVSPLAVHESPCQTPELLVGELEETLAGICIAIACPREKRGHFVSCTLAHEDIPSLEIS